MLNRTTLIGRLTKDPELRKTASGISSLSFTLACDRDYKPKDGQGQTTDFIGCQAFRQAADYLASYAHKGTMIGLDGRIQTRSYEDQQHRKVYVTEVLADKVYIVNNPQQRAAEPQQAQQNHPYNPNQTASAQAGNGYYTNDGFGSGFGLDLDDDSLPF